MNIAGTKIWYGKKDRQALQLIESMDISRQESKMKIFDLAEDMVKRARQAKAQVETVYQFLMKEAN